MKEPPVSDPPAGPHPDASFPDLAGRCAVVTGASRGIGCGIAEVLGSQRMRLVLAARSADAGEVFAERLRGAGVECAFVPADLATPAGAKAVFDAAVERFGRVHLLVNNAARLGGRTILDTDEALFAESFERNVRMVYGPSRLLAAHMADAGGGSIVNISSVGGLRGHRRHFSYDASKGATDAMTRSMALDLAPHGVRVNAVAPGATNRQAPAGPPGEKERFRGSMIPLGRLGTPHEVGWAVAFLASDVSAYTTGQVLYVDGGMVTQLTPPGIWV